MTYEEQDWPSRLVKRLTDLKYLATVPAPGAQCAQWSSYDRASRYDEASGKYVRWDANGDGDGIIRKENGKLVFKYASIVGDLEHWHYDTFRALMRNHQMGKAFVTFTLNGEGAVSPPPFASG